MAAPLLEARTLHSYYGSSHVLQGVDFAVGAGEVVALMVRNGIGQPAVLRSMLGVPKSRTGRVDTAAYQGYLIPPYYDSLIAKLIVSGSDRAEAIARGRRALDFFVVEGIKTTIPMHRRILDDPDFIAGKISTRFMERFAEAS